MKKNEESKGSGSRLSLALSPRQSQLLDDMAKATGMTKNELLRHAVGLLDIVVKARDKGLVLALTDDETEEVRQRIAVTV
jgi:hypothetical protein